MMRGGGVGLRGADAQKRRGTWRPRKGDTWTVELARRPPRHHLGWQGLVGFGLPDGTGHFVNTLAATMLRCFMFE